MAFRLKPLTLKESHQKTVIRKLIDVLAEKKKLIPILKDKYGKPIKEKVREYMNFIWGAMRAGLNREELSRQIGPIAEIKAMEDKIGVVDKSWTKGPIDPSPVMTGWLWFYYRGNIWVRFWVSKKDSKIVLGTDSSILKEITVDEAKLLLTTTNDSANVKVNIIDFDTFMKQRFLFDNLGSK